MQQQLDVEGEQLDAKNAALVDDVIKTEKQHRTAVYKLQQHSRAVANHRRRQRAHQGNLQTFLDTIDEEFDAGDPNSPISLVEEPSEASNDPEAVPDPLAGIDLFATPLELPIEGFNFINSLSSDDLEAFSAAFPD